MTLLPDLLHPVPVARVDIGLVREALGFAFSGGGSDVTNHELFEPKGAAASSWDPDHYERDLFLETFVARHIVVAIGGHAYQLSSSQLHQLLQRPPSDPRIARFRHELLHELVSVPVFRAQLEQTYVLALRVRTLLGDSGLGHRLDVNHRRIEILVAARALIEHMAHSFAGASSGLSRLSEFAQSVVDSLGYARLAKLLELESGLAALDVRLGIGYDGQLRHFEIVHRSEQTLNPFYASRLGRFVRKLMLLVRGYRFSDAEVLSRFVDQVFQGVEAELARMFQLIGDLEFYLAALHFRDDAMRHGLHVCLPLFAAPTPDQGENPRELVALFNPLLLEASAGPTACTLRARRHDDTVVLTGPNSGGKTRLLQALALAQLLAQSGFFVPAREARLVWAPAMFLSISEGSHAGQREGRLGMELMRIRSVFESAKVGAFVVVDELCSGTNPGEGEEIFEMVLGLLRELGTQAFISTHFLQFAEGLHTSPERVARYALQFWQVELDSLLAPTYQFVSGVARSSLAQLTASRLGVTREELGALVERHKRASAQQRASTLCSRAEDPQASTLRSRAENPRASTLRSHPEDPQTSPFRSRAEEPRASTQPPGRRKASPA